MTDMKAKKPSFYKFEAFRARFTGANVRQGFDWIPWEIRKRNAIYKYREVFQMLILGEKYATIARKTNLSEQCIGMMVVRHAPHLLRGRGNRKKPLVEEGKKEKAWNPKSCRYE